MDSKPKLGAWISFADGHKPKGKMFVGVAIVHATNSNAAVARCIELGIWPEGIAGLDVDIVPVDMNNYEPQDIDRMLNFEDAQRLGNQVTVRRH